MWVFTTFVIVFHWYLSDYKSPKIFKTLQSNLTGVSKAVVLIVFIWQVIFFLLFKTTAGLVALIGDPFVFSSTVSGLCIYTMFSNDRILVSCSIPSRPLPHLVVLIIII